MNIIQLADAYLTDPDSPFHTKRYVTQEGYKRLIARLVKEMGDRELAAIGTRDLLRAHAEWMAGDRIAMAHSLATQLRILIGFGATILENSDCQRLRNLLSGLRFKNTQRRTVWLTADQGEDIRDYATMQDYYCVALAQAFQTDCAFRQKDVLGEWIPIDRPELSTIIDGDFKWVRGLTREEVNADMILTHQTSKRGQILSFDLKECPAVMEEWFSAPTSGPLIVDPETGLPYQAWKFRRIWRRVATAARVPRNTWNMDSRAGAITKAFAGGANPDDIRKYAGHSNLSTTMGYSRGSAEAIARVLGAKKDEDE